MKLMSILALALALLVPMAPLSAADPATSDVVVGFTGGASWRDATTGICVWYFPLLGDLDLASLFTAGPSGGPLANREHSYLLWVSDFTVEMLPAPTPYALALVPTGTATVYFRSDPANRNFNNLLERSTWGIPVASFVRKASLIRSADGFGSDNFVFSADLVWSVPFTVNGQKADFKKFVPSGMTCFEFGQQGSSWETGVCVAKGK